MTKKQDNHILKHQESTHPNQSEPKFEFKVQGTFKSAFTRQISEAVMIRRAGGSILNSKGVYNRCHLPRLVVEDNRKNKEGQEAPINTVVWQDKREYAKRNEPLQHKRQSKKIKIDKENVNPRVEGLEKRKFFCQIIPIFQLICV